jgi:formylglycine-generating enzyme required for sulfatase activity
MDYLNIERWITTAVKSLLVFGLILFGCSNPRGQDNLSTRQSTESGEGVLTQKAESTLLPRVNPNDEAALVFVPQGVFEMGAEPERSYEICLQYREGCQLEDFLDEQPVHQVMLDSYWIYDREVTNAMYRVCVEDGVCGLPAFTDFYNNQLYSDHPVVYVSWYAAAAYCEWAGGRLPTEAEWEKAARGTDGRMFPWGELASCEQANLSGCSPEMTMVVGSLPGGASPYGVLDMAGNAAEWVSDWYEPEYYQNSLEENPHGPMTGELKVIRGGSWKNPGVGLRVTNRGGNYPEVFSTGIGFRCVVIGD